MFWASRRSFTEGAQSMPSNDFVYLKRSQAAAYVRQEWGLPCSATALARLSLSGRGPRCQNLDDRFAIYRPTDLDLWAQSRISEPHLTDAGARRMIPALAETAISVSSVGPSCTRRTRTRHGVLGMDDWLYRYEAKLIAEQEARQRARQADRSARDAQHKAVELERAVPWAPVSIAMNRRPSDC
jgi:hypothetical protein